MKKQEYIEKYGEEAYLRQRERSKKWEQANQSKRNEYHRTLMRNNPQLIVTHNETWKKNNPKTYRAHSIIWGYNQSDKRKGLPITNNVTTKWVVDNIFSGQKCVYCGDQDWTHLGCDRIDNSKPHTADNIVCSCFICNSDRADRYTVEEFKKYRSLHPRECDIPKAPAIQLSETGALKKRVIPSR